MPDTIITPNMDLILPVVSTRPGPEYAADINETIIVLDRHDHSDGYGVQITPSGLDINADLPIGSHNLTGVRTVRLDSQLATISGTTDKNCVYDVSGDLWFNNGSGTPIQITAASSVSGASATANVWATVNTTSNLTINSSDTFVAIVCRQVAPINIQLPAASSVSNGRYYVVIDAQGNSGADPITVLRAGSDTIEFAGSNVVLQSANGSWFLRSNGVSNWDIIYSAFAGLTSAALTYSSAVLDHTGLTKGPSPSTDSSATIRAPNDLPIISARNAANAANISVLGTDSSDNIILGYNDGDNDIFLNSGGTIHLQGNVVNSGTLLASNTITLGSSANLAFGSLSNQTLGTFSAINYASAKTAYQLIPAWRAQSVGSGGSDAWSIAFTGTTRSGLISGASSNAFILSFDPIMTTSAASAGPTLASIDFSYMINGSARSPTTRLNFQVWRQTLANTGVPDSLFASAQQVASYSSFGSPLSQTFNPTQNNIIDTSQYYYWIVVTDEGGSGAVGGNEARGFRLGYSVGRVTL